MNQIFFLRQLDIADPSQFKDKPVTVIGAGGIARSAHLPSLGEMADVHLVAICDIIEARAARRALSSARLSPRAFSV